MVVRSTSSHFFSRRQNQNKFHFCSSRLSKKFKERAVKLSRERDNIKDLAAEQGISPERIYKWRAEFARHGEASFLGHGVERLSDEGRQLKEMQKKLRNTEL